MSRRRVAAILLALGLGACATTPPPHPADQFMAGLATLCGRTVPARLVSTDPADAAFAAGPLVMGPVACADGQVRVPLAVGEDRSRTWVVTRTEVGVRLKHDHRHADGSVDELSDYGGESDGAGTATRQAFPADAFSRILFERTGRQVSMTNVWAVEIVPGTLFAYELRRPNRFFRIEADFSAPR